MITEEQALYQTKLVLDCLPIEEYILIPRKIIKFIESNMSVDESIKLDPDKEIEEQNLDEKTIGFLDMIMKAIDVEIQIRNEENGGNAKEANDKLIQAKAIMEDYKNLMDSKQKELEALKTTNNYLNDSLNKIPKFIKRLFIKKDNLKYLEENNKGE